MKRVLMILALLSIAACTFAAFDWLTVKTDTFMVFYKKPYEKRALKLLSSLEYFRELPEKITGNRLYHVPVLFEDFGQYAPWGGYTNPVYYQLEVINNQGDEGCWTALVGVHEYTHMLTMTEANGFPGVLKFLFGNLFSPTLFSPGWILEGITTYNEAQVSKYYGRLNNGSFDSYMEACIAEKKFPSIMKATYNPVEAPSYMGHYLFGGEFFDFLSKEYGEEKFSLYFDKYNGWIMSYVSPIVPFFGIDFILKEVYGKGAEELWAEWEKYEKKKHKGYKPEGKNETGHGWYAFYPSIYKDRLYYRKTTIDKTGPHSTRQYNEIAVINLDNGEKSTFHSTTSFYTHPVVFSMDRAYYSVAETKPGYDNVNTFTYGDYVVVYERGLKNGKERQITKGEIRTYCVYGGKMLYASDRKYDAGSDIYEVDLNTLKKTLVFRTGYLVTRFASGPGIIAAQAREQGRNPDLFIFNPDKKSFKRIVSSPYFEGNPSVYDGKIFYNANYGERVSAYAYSLSSKKIYRLTQNGYAESPVYHKKNRRIYYVGLNTGGYDVYSKAAEFKSFRMKKYKTENINIPVLKKGGFERGNYTDSLPYLFPKIRLPVFLIDQDTNYAGLILESQDATGEIFYSSQVWYDLGENRIETDSILRFLHFAPLSLFVQYNNYDAENKILAGVDFPLYRSRQPGLSNINAGLSYYAFEGFWRRQLTPSVNIGFNFPSTVIGLYGAAAVEGPALGSVYMSREGFNGAFSLTQYLPDTKVGIRGQYVWDPDNCDPPAAPVRGYDSEMRGNEWVFLRGEISRPLFKVRGGIWWFSFVPYVEDITGALFVDSAFTENETRFTYGAELHAEVHVLFAVPLDLGVWAGMNGESDFSYGLILRTPTGIF